MSVEVGIEIKRESPLNVIQDVRSYEYSTYQHRLETRRSDYISPHALQRDAYVPSYLLETQPRLKRRARGWASQAKGFAGPLLGLQ